MLKLVTGYLYVISDQYFIDVGDPYIPINHNKSHFRPFYLAIYDSSTDLYWMIPLSSRVSKYQKIYKQLYYKWSNRKESDAIKIRDNLMLGIKTIKIASRSSVLLFQNIIPVSRKYIARPYYIENVPFTFDSETTKDIINQANRVMILLKGGFKFLKTQPDVNKIENFLLNNRQ